MTHTAKLFKNGRSQAVRLPAQFRFDCQTVYIRRDPKTGDVILSKRPDTWAAFFALREQTDVPDDFMAHRDNPAESPRDVFDD